MRCDVCLSSLRFLLVLLVLRFPSFPLHQPCLPSSILKSGRHPATFRPAQSFRVTMARTRPRPRAKQPESKAREPLGGASSNSIQNPPGQPNPPPVPTACDHEEPARPIVVMLTRDGRDHWLVSRQLRATGRRRRCNSRSRQVLVRSCMSLLGRA